MPTVPEYLKNRSTTDDRYSLTEVYIDDFVAPGRRRYGLWKPVALKSRPELPLDEGTYQRYTVSAADIGRIDRIAHKYYQNVAWWYVIALFNHIANPLTDLVIGQVLLIPTKEFVTSKIEAEL